MCSFSKEGEQEDVSLCGFAFANGEVGEEQSFASSMSYGDLSTVGEVNDYFAIHTTKVRASSS